MPEIMRCLRSSGKKDFAFIHSLPLGYTTYYTSTTRDSNLFRFLPLFRRFPETSRKTIARAKGYLYPLGLFFDSTLHSGTLFLDARVFLLSLPSTSENSHNIIIVSVDQRSCY